MRTHVEFTSKLFPPYPGEEEEMVNPGMWGKRLAEFLRAKLGAKGFETDEPIAEDWGWFVGILHTPFPMALGCATFNDGTDSFLVFIDPSKPTIRRGLFKKIDTVADVERLAQALDKILRSEPGITSVNWVDAP